VSGKSTTRSTWEGGGVSREKHHLLLRGWERRDKLKNPAEKDYSGWVWWTGKKKEARLVREGREA